MKKDISILLFLSGLFLCSPPVFAQSSNKIQSLDKNSIPFNKNLYNHSNIKIIESKKINKWLIERGTYSFANNYYDVYTAEILSLDGESQLKISCRSIVDSPPVPQINISIKSFRDDFKNIQDITFMFYTAHHTAPARAKSSSSKNQEIILTPPHDQNFKLANLIGINNSLVINYKNTKNQNKQLKFDLRGSYEVTTYLGKMCFTSPVKSSK